MDWSVGFVATRVFSGFNASNISCRNLEITFFLFRHCVRSSSLLNWSIPFLLIRPDNFWRINCFCLSVKISDAFTSSNNITFDATLFTFCPPLPPLLTAEKTASSISLSIFTFILFLMYTSMVCYLQPHRLQAIYPLIELKFGKYNTCNWNPLSFSFTFLHRLIFHFWIKINPIEIVLKLLTNFVVNMPVWREEEYAYVYHCR